MFGHDWQPGLATIVDSRIKSASGDGKAMRREYVADITGADWATFRATIQEPTIATDFWTPSVGAQVQVLVDRKSQKVKFDKSDPQLSYKARERAEKQRFDDAAQSPPGS